MALVKVRSASYKSTGLVYTFELCSIPGAEALALMEALEATDTPEIRSLLARIRKAASETRTTLPDRSMTEPRVLPPIIR